MATLREIVIADPFAALGVAEEADDAAIRQRYLALVRAYPPDRAPERFQAYRQAFEAIRDARARAATRLLHSTDGALLRLKRLCLTPKDPAPRMIAEDVVRDLLVDSLGDPATD